MFCPMVADRRGSEVDFVGDGTLLFTGPFHPDGDALGQRQQSSLPADGGLDGAGRLVALDRSLDPLLRGSLTFGNPDIGLLTQFTGSDTFHRELEVVVEDEIGGPVSVSVSGMFFPDGYGAVAVRIDVPGAWTDDRRSGVLDSFGQGGRDRMAGWLHDVLLPVVSDLEDRCCSENSAETVLPYFNLTYVAHTTHPNPGRATLPDELRSLVYPRTAEPIGSDSPWLDEFFYAGYGYFLLASASPAWSLRQFELLILHLGVLYSRMDRRAQSADRVIRESLHQGNVGRLIALERELSADYHALVTPTFSFDHHILIIRDRVLSAWGVDRLRQRAETLLRLARQAVEDFAAETQARRVKRVRQAVTLVALLSFVSCLEAAYNLWAALS